MDWFQAMRSGHFRRRAQRLRRAGLPAKALEAMRAAARLAPREQLRPMLLCQQAELETELGQSRRALETYGLAKALMKKHSRYWKVGAHQGLPLDIDRAMEALERRLAAGGPEDAGEG
jgi:hypothetical protein